MAEQNADLVALRSELVELKDQISQLARRIVVFEKTLN
jgi:hypothetical protein